MGSAEVIAGGQRALAAGDWSAARAAFEETLADGESAEELDGLGPALWWQNEPGGAIELRRRAYAEFVRRRERARAIEIAVFLVREFFMLHGNLAAMTGWLARAQTLLEEQGDCAEAVWLELTRGRLAHDPPTMGKHARQAIALAREFGERELEVVASSLVGLALVYGLRVPEGMVLLDEEMAAATGGELESFWCISEVYCNTLLACERAGDLERAEQWLRVIEEFSRRHGCGSAALAARRCARRARRARACRGGRRLAPPAREAGGPDHPRCRGGARCAAVRGETELRFAPGLTNREIAGRLFLSVKTVEHNVSRVLGKLGLKTRAEAAAAHIRRKGERAAPDRLSSGPRGR